MDSTQCLQSSLETSGRHKRVVYISITLDNAIYGGERINFCIVGPLIGANASNDPQLWNSASMLYARISMRPSQSKFQYGWKSSILSSLTKNQESEIDRKLQYY